MANNNWVCIFAAMFFKLLQDSVEPWYSVVGTAEQCSS